MDNKLALVAVGYNRVNSLQRLLASLEKADYLGDKIELYISLDKAKTNEVVDFANSFNWSHGEKHVLTYPERLGLRKHILKCGDLLEKYDAIAMLEDDVVVSDGFYNYMKQAVEFYKDCDKVAGISLYSNRWNEFAGHPFTPSHSEYDTYFFQFAESRGQIWLKKQWKKFKEWYAQNEDVAIDDISLPEGLCHWPSSSWKKYHVKYCVEQNKYFAYPYVSMTTIFSDIGTHVAYVDSTNQVQLYHGSKKCFKFANITDKDGVYYDVFYERKFEAVNPEYKTYDKTCFNLYGYKRDYTGYTKVITFKKMPYSVLKSFGLYMKPQEENILYDVPGDILFLYDLSNKQDNHIVNNIDFYRYHHDIYGFRIEQLYCILDSAIRKIKRLVR